MVSKIKIGNYTCQGGHYFWSNLILFFAVSITDAFKEVLRDHLGDGWYQLGTAMGWQRTDIDAIKERTDVTLKWKIDKFLTTRQFPLFDSNRQTAEFLIETLETASLPNIAATVKRALEHKFSQEGTQCFHVLLFLSLHSKSDSMSCFSVILLGMKSAADYVPYQVTCLQHAHVAHEYDRIASIPIHCSAQGNVCVLFFTVQKQGSSSLNQYQCMA